MKIVVTILFVLTSVISLRAQSHFANKPDSNFHLYILMGQSNMAGRGSITEEYKNRGNPNIFMLNKNNEWEIAHHPLHYDKSIAGVGPGLAFAFKMSEQNPSIKIGLIPCAVGGTSINSWQPGGFDEATKTHPYDDAEQRIKEAMKTGIVKGMLWHQGESDTSPAAANGYLTKLQALIERVRLMTYSTQLPVVAGELGRYKEQYSNINQQLRKLPSIIKYAAVASSENLKDKGDSTHFDSISAEKLGERFAEKMIFIQRNGKQ